MENSIATAPACPDSGEIIIGTKKYFTTKKLAETLRVSERTLIRWDKSKIGPPKTAIGKTILFNVDSVASWLESREHQPEAPRRAGRGRGGR